MEARRQLTESERAEVVALLEDARAADGHEPLAEHKRIRLEHTGGDPGFVALLHRGADGALDGYAQLAPARGSTGLEVVVRPAARATDGADAIATALVQGASDEVARAGGGTLRYFLSAPGAGRIAATEHAGFRLDRRLVQMTLPLPPARAVVDAARVVLGAFVVRAFRPGHDEQQWLEVNARAFASHPEQGSWTMTDLLDREAAEWFDAQGFLVAESDGRLAASCLTKLHRSLEPVTGEIYVISVDPAWHGRGLGRAMTVAGLDHLASRGAGRGMLYVDGDNTAAMGLYESLEFEVDHVDLAYVTEVPRTGG